MFDIQYVEPLHDMPFTYAMGPHIRRDSTLHALFDNKTNRMAAQFKLEKSKENDNVAHVTSFAIDALYKGTGLDQRLWDEIKLDYPGHIILAFPNLKDDKALNQEQLRDVYQRLGFKKSPTSKALHYVNAPKAKPHSVDYHRQFALPEELKKLSFDQGSNAALRTLGF